MALLNEIKAILQKAEDVSGEVKVDLLKDAFNLIQKALVNELDELGTSEQHIQDQAGLSLKQINNIICGLDKDAPNYICKECGSTYNTYHKTCVNCFTQNIIESK